MPLLPISLIKIDELCISKMCDKEDSEKTSYPSLSRCLLAIIYDSILLIPVLMTTSLITLLFCAAISGLNSEGNLAMQIPVFLRQLIIALTIFFFFSWFWIKNGQTLGMQAWRIKLVSTNGKNISLKQASMRLVGAVISAGFFGLGYLWVLLEAKNHSWHDLISGTRLILLPKTDSRKSSN